MPRISLSVVNGRWTFTVDGRTGFTEVIPFGVTYRTQVQTPDGVLDLGYVLDEMIGLSSMQIASIIRF